MRRFGVVVWVRGGSSDMVGRPRLMEPRQALQTSSFSELGIRPVMGNGEFGIQTIDGGGSSERIGTHRGGGGGELDSGRKLS